MQQENVKINAKNRLVEAWKCKSLNTITIWLNINWL